MEKSLLVTILESLQGQGAAGCHRTAQAEIVLNNPELGSSSRLRSSKIPRSIVQVPRKEHGNGAQRYKALTARGSVTQSWSQGHEPAPQAPVTGLAAKRVAGTVNHKTQHATEQGDNSQAPAGQGLPRPRAGLTGHVAQVAIGDGSAELGCGWQHLRAGLEPWAGQWLRWWLRW